MSYAQVTVVMCLSISILIPALVTSSSAVVGQPAPTPDQGGGLHVAHRQL